MVGVGLDQPGYLRSKLYIVRHAGYNEQAYCLLDKIRVSSSFFLKEIVAPIILPAARLRHYCKWA